MFRKVTKAVAVFTTAISLLCSGNVMSVSATVTTDIKKVALSPEGAQLMQSIASTLKLSDEQISALSSAAIPVNEVYAFVDATVPSNGTSIITNTTYRNDFLTFSAYKNGTNCGSNAPIPGGTVGSNQSYVLCNYINISAGSENMVTLRFTPNNNTFGLSYIVNNVYSGNLIQEPNVIYKPSDATVNTDVTVPGDINLDGYIDDSDCNLLANLIVENSSVIFTAYMLKSCDVNHDGLVNSTDLSILVQYRAGLRPYLIDLS